MMKKRRGDSDVFGLSFLDIISCGFGAVVLLVLISDFAVNEEAIQTKYDELSAQILKLANLKSDLMSISEEQKKKSSVVADTSEVNEMLAARLSSKEKILENQLSELASMQVMLDSLVDDITTRKRASIRSATAKKRVEEVGGIPVDSEYVVFIVDTSGSMKDIWNKVTRHIENVINIHPTVKGFQILNDNGEYLITAYKGKWITDTKKMRKNSIDLFKMWSAMSNSSPVEGIKKALKTYGKANQKLSIYVFGDDFSGGNFDQALNEINSLNFNKITKSKIARIHAIEFSSPRSTNRFPILMRAVTEQNNGTFLSI
mgnify:FL=1